jgi:recombinational DNA repair ATPase RecF/DNA uptake protein ComE-like DNA-binding protein
MIKLESAHIEEVRGIRKLDIDLERQTFAISGPNGSGKSGVIDAIEFGLTGEISRLTGKGTKGLTIAEHGPHVDKTKFPDAAFVRLQVFFPNFGKTATITRKLSAPRKPKIEPAEPDILAAIKEVEAHPEITLSRREVLRFIVAEPTTRSQEIQIILKLEIIGQTRSALNTAYNKLTAVHRNAEATQQSRREALQRHLQIATFDASEVLVSVNERRVLLGLPTIEKLATDTKLDAGITSSGKTDQFNKQSAVRDLTALVEALAALPSVGTKEADAILSGLARLEDDPALLSTLQHRSLIEKGLSLVDGAQCPLCDHEWEDEAHLRAHLAIKLAKSEEAGRLRDQLLQAAAELSKESLRLRALLPPVAKIALGEAASDAARQLTALADDLDALRQSLGSLDEIMGLKARLETGWAQVPVGLSEKVSALVAKIQAKPDQSALVDAQTFLTTAQLRISDYRQASRERKRAEEAANAAKAAYEAYCRAMEEELNRLYEEVQEDFCAYYRTINKDDEDGFTAKLTPAEGRLDLLVNFYERGLFPPGAFHSEGHQDGMGVCLYLALQKRLLGDRFAFALLDDVVMSVDADHRYEFCKLLKTHFPNTQFVITTHDRLWAEQMRSAGLVTTKTSLVFQNWSVETGPIVESNAEIWAEVGEALSKGNVRAAAAALRHHLKYASRHLANDLAATPVFRADGNYELGELLPSVIGRMRDLCGKAASAAQSWGNVSAKEAAVKRKEALSTSSAASNVEQWAVNRAVHYNEWANFGKKDFEPVVRAFRDLLDQFRCAQCQGWLYVTPKGRPESLRCSCTAISLNLKPKPK